MAARHHSKRSTEEIDDGLSVEEEYAVNAPTITREDWRSRFEHVGLGSRWEQMERLSKEEIRLTPLVVDEQEIKVGASKIGGCPDLPIGQNWFKDGNGKSLSFLAQVNFGDTKAFDSNHQLPSIGMIYFFYSAEQSAWGFDPKDEDKFRVFYFDDEVSQLKRAEFPSDLADNARFASSSVIFENSISLPDFESK